MEPETESADEGLAGLLNRALNKGAILNADLLITVNDVPLVALRLQAAIANVETMIEYGIMTDWDPAMDHIDDEYIADHLEPDEREATDDAPEGDERTGGDEPSARVRPAPPEADATDRR